VRGYISPRTCSLNAASPLAETPSRSAGWGRSFTPWRDDGRWRKTTAASCWALIGQDRKSDCNELLFAPSHWSPEQSRKRNVEDQWTVLSFRPTPRATDLGLLSRPHSCLVSASSLSGVGTPSNVATKTTFVAHRVTWHASRRWLVLSPKGPRAVRTRLAAPDHNREGYQQPSWQPRGSFASRAKTRSLTHASFHNTKFASAEIPLRGCQQPLLHGRPQRGHRPSGLRLLPRVATAGI